MEKNTATTSTYSDGQASEATANVAGAMQRGVESAGDALHSGINKVADPARHAIDSISNTAHGAIDSLASGASHTAHRFADQTRRLTEAPAKALDYSKSRVQERPLEAVGIALALGFIFGRLTAR